MENLELGTPDTPVLKPIEMDMTEETNIPEFILEPCFCAPPRRKIIRKRRYKRK